MQVDGQPQSGFQGVSASVLKEVRDWSASRANTKDCVSALAKHKDASASVEFQSNRTAVPGH